MCISSLSLLGLLALEEGHGCQGISNLQLSKKLFNNGRKRWELPQSTTLRKFTNALEEEDIIFRAMLEIGGVNYDFYFLPESPAFYILNQLLTGSYVSHSTALKLWGLAGDTNDNRFN